MTRCIATRVTLAAGLLAGIAILGCSSAPDCPDTYGACVEAIEAQNAAYRACGQQEALQDVEEHCGTFRDVEEQGACVDCVERYRCHKDAYQCGDAGFVESSLSECVGCMSGS